MAWDRWPAWQRIAKKGRPHNSLGRIPLASFAEPHGQGAGNDGSSPSNPTSNRFTLIPRFHFGVGRLQEGRSAAPVPVPFTRAEALRPSASVQFAVQSGISAAGDGGLGVSARSNLLRSSATSASRSAVSASTISNETLPESHSFRCPTCCPLR